MAKTLKMLETLMLHLSRTQQMNVVSLLMVSKKFRAGDDCIVNETLGLTESMFNSK